MSLKITKAGLLDTVQDNGRWGYQHLGINPGGAMDRFSAALANALLGKPLSSAVIELHFPPAQIRFQKAAVICLTGAHFTPTINGNEIPTHQPLAIGENAVLAFRKKERGARCYLALLNDLHLEPWLNSVSTNLKAAAGGAGGRALQKEDEIPFSHLSFAINDVVVSLPWKYAAQENESPGIEVLPGPEWDWLSTQSQALFLSNSFRITPASDRMGYRLQGAALQPLHREQLVSSAVTFGTVQLLPNGQTIVLMADHQTTGGYPRLAQVISAHLPTLAQMSAGDNVKWALTSAKAAEEKAVAQQKVLHQLQNTCKLKIENWLHAHHRH